MENEHVAETTKKRSFKRSPSYPAIDLKEALDKARAFYKSEGENKANVEIVVQSWGYKNAKVGPALSALAALKKFGLLEFDGDGIRRTAKLSQLALKILRDDRTESPDRAGRIRQAALLPEIHSELWKEFNGSFPSDDNLKYTLKCERDFSDTGAIEFIKQFRATIAFAKLDNSNAMSYIKEDKDEAGGDPPQDQGSTAGRVGSGGGQNPPPPIIPPQNKSVQMRTYPIAFLDGSQGSFTIPLPMSEQDWNRMKQQIDFLMPVHVKKEQPQNPPTEQKKEGDDEVF